MCLTETSTPAPKNEDLNRLPSFALNFFCLHASVYVMYYACVYCVVACVSACVCTCAWCVHAWCLCGVGGCCVHACVRGVCVVCAMRVRGVCCVLCVRVCGVVWCVLRFFEFQQTSNDFDQLTSQRVQVTENYKLCTCI
jgi:hypothetical protein